MDWRSLREHCNILTRERAVDAACDLPERCVYRLDYLELQNNRPFVNTKSSFLRGNSPSFLKLQ